jgi:peptidoglycan/xylan/chitin deacetylase (PgdA/CDA1 family)
LEGAFRMRCAGKEVGRWRCSLAIITGGRPVRRWAARNGSIVLMHDGANVVEALPEIINGLRARGFRLVSLDELLGLPWQPAFR